MRNKKISYKASQNNTKLDEFTNEQELELRKKRMLKEEE